MHTAEKGTVESFKKLQVDILYIHRHVTHCILIEYLFFLYEPIPQSVKS